VIARIVEPTSLLDIDPVLAGMGRVSASLSTANGQRVTDVGGSPLLRRDDDADQVARFRRFEADPAGHELEIDTQRQPPGASRSQVNRASCWR
jgi:hypothetical protein